MSLLNNQTIVKLNKLFYKKEAIKETILEFKKVCGCLVKEDDKYFLIYIKKKDKDLKKLNFEFANYALALMK